MSERQGIQPRFFPPPMPHPVLAGRRHPTLVREMARAPIHGRVIQHLIPQLPKQPSVGPNDVVAIIPGQLAQVLSTFILATALAGTGGGGGTAITSAIYSSNFSPLVLPPTSNLLTIVRQGTPAPITIQLPSSPTQDLYVGIKDGGNNFAVNNATVVTTDGSTIDGYSGAVGIVMNFRSAAQFFLFDGAAWNRV